MPNTDICSTLEQILKDSPAPRSSSFWEKYNSIGELDLEQFMTLSAGASRRLGRDKLEFDQKSCTVFNDFPVDLQQHSKGFAGRILLAAAAKPAFLREMIGRGDDEEQAAAILSLNLRNDGADYKDNVVHACRTNSTTVFSAVSQNNPYAASYFSDHEFKQLTMKTIFMGLEFTAIHGLEERFHGDLGQSLTDFFDERRAAGRWLPDSVLDFMKTKGLLK